MSDDCPICRIKIPPKGPYRFRITGRFWDKNKKMDCDLATATRLVGAREMVERFKKWPAIDPDSLSITDTMPELDQPTHAP